MTRKKIDENDDIPMVAGVIITDEPDVSYNVHSMAQSVPITPVVATMTTTTLPLSQSAGPPPTPPPPPPPPVGAPGHHRYPMAPLRLGRYPTRVDCFYCNKNDLTIVRSHPGWFTWLMFFVLLLLFWPLCWLPFVIPSCQSADHVCRHCGRLLCVTEGCE